ncbi:MAG: hypothetical protein F8N37_06630, partial [Telmatospirillum sp.]|nr:hypothetical protein [Telmatospirillum sp.]
MTTAQAVAIPLPKRDRPSFSQAGSPGSWAVSLAVAAFLHGGVMVWLSHARDPAAAVPLRPTVMMMLDLPPLPVAPSVPSPSLSPTPVPPPTPAT